MKYPKINTLWKRDEQNRFNIIEGDFSCPEFNNIKSWHITEKIDGTNVRVIYTPAREIIFAGKTDDAQLPSFLIEYLQKAFTIEKMILAFPDAPLDKIILFGEGYGPKIQSGGKYRDDCSFALFDAWIDGWWLERISLNDIASKLGLDAVPELGVLPIEEAILLARDGFQSMIAKQNTRAEGIVARSHPLMLFRNGDPIMWKLKVKDYLKLKS